MGLALKKELIIEGRLDSSHEKFVALKLAPQITGAARREALLSQLFFKKPVRVHIREFAAILATFLLIIVFVKIWKERPPETSVIIGGIALGIAAIGYTAPYLLYHFWKGWMTFAHYLALVMTFLILAVSWSVMVIPLSLILRLVGKSVMKTSYKASGVQSYWEIKDPKDSDFKLLERQF